MWSSIAVKPPAICANTYGNNSLDGSLPIGFTSTNTGKTYTITKRLDCNSDHLIYLVTCAKCGGQYVGKSTTDFKRRQRGGLGHHFGGNNGCGYQNVKIMPPGQGLPMKPSQGTNCLMK